MIRFIPAFFVLLIALSAAEARTPFRIYNDAQVARSNRAVVVQPPATSSQREVIRSMHILDRPNRIGHFYGNTVRRVHQYGQVLPRLRRR